MRFAVISDVHGNALALDAVLADIAGQGVDATLCLGDHVSGPLDPAGSAARLMDLTGPVIRGNHDRWVAQGRRDVRDLDPVDHFARAQLTADQHLWLANLPATEVFNREIFLCHGTPASDNEPWIDGWYHDRRTHLPDEASVAAQAEGLDYPILLCGHTHTARQVRLRDGRQIVNPGSVGLQLVHGSPDARYAIIERRNGRWLIDLRVVEYDHHAAARQALANGFTTWQDALTTGWVDANGLF